MHREFIGFKCHLFKSLALEFSTSLCRTMYPLYHRRDICPSVHDLLAYDVKAADAISMQPVPGYTCTTGELRQMQ